MNNTSKFATICLVFLILVFSFLRLIKLNEVPVSLFSDEVDIGYQVKSLLQTGKDYQGNFLPLQFHSFSDVRTGLPIYATALISLLPGISIDQAIRITPALFSLFGMLGIYLLTNSLFQLFGITRKNIINPGLSAAFLLSITPWHFTYSRTGFELSQLFAFFTLGLACLILYLLHNRPRHIVASLILLSLTPAVYSTAKLSLLFLPLLFLCLPGFWEKFKAGNQLKVFVVLLFFPLFLIFLSGGASQRFSELAIFTDPTLSTRTDYLRQVDLGQNPQLGSSPSLVSSVTHNKPLLIATSFVKNLFGPVSTDFLFVAGDPNQRHALPGWGMMLKSFSLLLLIGLLRLFFEKKKRFLIFLTALAVLSVIPSALTRDGAYHSSRTFMLILPLTLVSSLGLYTLLSRRMLSILLAIVLLFESFLYFHDYFIHYPLISERDFHAGLKELVSEVKKYPNQPIILTRTYEPSLIFFLYYTDFPPEKAQSLIMSNRLTIPITGDLNLEGVKITDTNIYLANVRDFGTHDPLVFKDAIYVLPGKEAALLIEKKYAEKISDISFPSGELLFTTVRPISVQAQ